TTIQQPALTDLIFTGTHSRTTLIVTFRTAGNLTPFGNE
ncbi:unnamed protein product, partial [marine sediment metagenome]